jgi:hypothetical protein
MKMMTIQIIKSRCGNRFVCVFRRKISGDLSEWTIQLGMTRRHSHSFFGRKVKVEKIIRHEKYNNGPVQHDHDIALFKVPNQPMFVLYYGNVIL